MFWLSLFRNCANYAEELLKKRTHLSRLQNVDYVPAVRVSGHPRRWKVVSKHTTLKSHDEKWCGVTFFVKQLAGSAVVLTSGAELTTAID